MLRSSAVKTVATTFVLVVATLLGGCGSPGPGEDPGLLHSGRHGTPTVPDPPPGDTALSAEAAADLRFVREEEKMARDVYLALQQRTGLVVFSNIAGSEAQHMSAMLTLLQRYGVADPVGNAGAGAFVDADIQGLYDDLVARGQASLVDALWVGAFIEEFDIVDIRGRLQPSPPADLVATFESLMRGSRNHLRAFARQLSALGVTYTPTYLSAEEYAQILSSGG
jgi:hypothetical protein